MPRNCAGVEKDSRKYEIDIYIQIDYVTFL